MRFPEIGIRMALGSSQGGVVWLMAREMGGVLGAGIPLGLLATLAFENSGGPVAIRTPDLYRVKVALHARRGQTGADGRIFD